MPFIKSSKKEIFRANDGAIFNAMIILNSDPTSRRGVKTVAGGRTGGLEKCRTNNMARFTDLLCPKIPYINIHSVCLFVNVLLLHFERPVAVATHDDAFHGALIIHVPYLGLFTMFSVVVDKCSCIFPF